MNASNTLRKIRIPSTDCELAIYDQGDPSHPAVVMSHSILSASTMWAVQADVLVANGFRVVRIDTRGHGASHSLPAPYSMDDLAMDVVTVLDALGIRRAHYIGVSLGGMIGFGLGVNHSDRLLSLCLCDARADMPTSIGAAWDERIALAQTNNSCAALAVPTTERWFGKANLAANPLMATQFQRTVSSTSVDGFVGCAKAIQGLDYGLRVSSIPVPITLLAGANDGAFPETMLAIQACIDGCRYESIPDAGHLPNIDQPDAFNAAMMGHFFQHVA